MRLRRSPATPPGPSGRSDQDVIAQQVAHAAATLPQDPRLIVFESMSGRQYSDSPRAIYEELMRQGIPARAVWSVRRDATGFPSDVPTLRRRSPEWIEAMATATVWVDNQGFTRWLPKPGRVHYLQTWHGTPLKKMGWSDPALLDVDEGSARELQAAYDRWDAITSPSEYFERTIVQAFRSDAEVLRHGMPRNDVLVHPLSNAVSEQRRTALGIAADAPTILFAPTRTADHEVSRRRWDAALTLAETGRHVLYRGHYSDDVIDAPGHPLLTDVTNVGDMADLLVIADALVTDYSSSMFDFALTDRPILLFQPDQSAYLDSRGANFDIREFSPGPIALTTAELTGLAQTMTQWSDEWALRRAQYRQRFGEFETGRASELVVRDHVAPLLERGAGPAAAPTP